MPNEAVKQFSAAKTQKTRKESNSALPTSNVTRYQMGLLTLLGSCSCIAGIICLIAILSPWGLVASALVSIVGALSATFMSFIIKVFAKPTARFKGLPLLTCSCLLSLVMILAATLLILDIAPFQATYMLAACGGSTGALLFAFWFPRICSIPEDSNSLRYISRVSISAFAIASLLVFFLPLFLPIFAIILFYMSFISGFYVFSKHEKQALFEGAPDDKPDRKSMINTQSTIMFALNHFQVGICCGTIETLPEVIVAIIALILGGLILFIDQRNKCVISESSLSSCSHSLPVVGLLFLCSNIAWLRLIAIFLLVGTFSMIFSVGLSAICEHCRICKLNAISVIAKASVTDFASLGLGLVIGYFIVDLDLFQSPTHLVSLAFGCVYCILASFVGKDRYPDETILLMGVDPKKLEKSSIQQKCSVLAERYELSPRQVEVLEMLAVGRNARFIAERLTIGQSTAQTHIRAIYTKLNVHSHQEVVDKVINTRLFGEE